jgi:hypothetical protein
MIAEKSIASMAVQQQNVTIPETENIMDLVREVMMLIATAAVPGPQVTTEAAITLKLIENVTERNVDHDLSISILGMTTGDQLNET